jgi:hypothetical protein
MKSTLVIVLAAASLALFDPAFADPNQPTTLNSNVQKKRDDTVKDTANKVGRRAPQTSGPKQNISTTKSRK